MFPLSISLDPWLIQGFIDTWFDALTHAVETATGWPGLVIIAVYSFLIAIVLPLPSEIVLVAPLDLGLSQTAKLALIMLVSGIGKAGGSVVALRVGNGVKNSGPVTRWLRRSRFNILEWSEKKSFELMQKWGYVGLAMALSVPFFPDTLSIYAFTILEEDYVKFAMATFAGSVGRLLVTVFVVGGTIVIAG